MLVKRKPKLVNNQVHQIEEVQAEVGDVIEEAEEKFQAENGVVIEQPGKDIVETVVENQPIEEQNKDTVQAVAAVTQAETESKEEDRSDQSASEVSSSLIKDQPVVSYAEVVSKVSELHFPLQQDEAEKIQNKEESHHAHVSQQMHKDDEEEREQRKRLHQEQEQLQERERLQLQHKLLQQSREQQQVVSITPSRAQTQQHLHFVMEAIAADEEEIVAVAAKSLVNAQEMQAWVEGRVDKLNESRFFALVLKYHGSSLAVDESSQRSRELLEACGAQEKTIWSIQQSTRVSHGVCGDGRAVTHSLPVAVAQCDEQALSQYATLVQAHVDHALVLLPSHKHALLSSRLAFELHFHDFFKTGAPSDDSAARVRDYLDVLFHFERVSQRFDASSTSSPISPVNAQTREMKSVDVSSESSTKTELKAFRSAIRFRIFQLVETLYRSDLARATFNQQFIWVHLLRTPLVGTWPSLEKLVPQCELGPVLRSMLLLLCGVARPTPPNEEWVQVDLDPSSNFWVNEEDLMTLLQVLNVNQAVTHYAQNHAKIDLIEECRVICKILVDGLAKIPVGMSQFALLVGKLLCDLVWTVAKRVFGDEMKSVDTARIQREYDALCDSVVLGLFHASQTSLRYFLSELPYAHLSLQARNRMFLAIFEGGAKQEHQVRSALSFTDWVQSPHLQKRREFFVELICKGQDGIHLANALTELAKQPVELLFQEQSTCSCHCIHEHNFIASETHSSGSDLPLIVVLELFHVAFIDSNARSLFWRESQQLFASICDSHPIGISLLLSLATSQIGLLGVAAKMLFATQLPLKMWRPSIGDIACLEQLLCTTLSSDSSKLGTYLVSYLSDTNSIVEAKKEDGANESSARCHCITHRHLLTMFSRVRFFHHARVVAASFSLIKTNQFAAPSTRWWTNVLLGFPTHTADQAPLVNLLTKSLASLNEGCCTSELSFASVLSAKTTSQTTPPQLAITTTTPTEAGEERMRGFQNRTATMTKDPVLAYLQLLLTTFGSDVTLFAQRGWPLLECLLDPGLKLRAERSDYQPLAFRALRDLLPILIIAAPVSSSLFPPEFSLTEAFFTSLRPRGLQFAVSWWSTLENRPTKAVCEQLIAVMSCQVVPRLQSSELGAVVGFWLAQVVLGSSGAANQRKYPECDVAWLRDPDYCFLVDSLCRFALLSITQGDASNELFAAIMEFCRRVSGALQVKDPTATVLDVIRRPEIPVYSAIIFMMLLAETEIGLSAFRDVGFIVAGSGEMSGLEGILAPSLTVNGAKTFIRKSLVRRWADVVPLFEFDNVLTPLAWQAFFLCYFLRVDTAVVVHLDPIHKLLASNLDRLLACSNDQYKYFACRFLYEGAEGVKLLASLKQALSQLSEVAKPEMRPLYHAMMLWLSMGDVNLWLSQVRSRVTPNTTLEASLSEPYMPYYLLSLLENSFALPATLWSQYLPLEQFTPFPVLGLPKTQEEQPVRSALASALTTGRTLRSQASTNLRTYTPAVIERNPSESLNVFVLHEWLTLPAWQLAQLDDKDGCIRAQFEQTTRASATLFSENLNRRIALDKEVLDALPALYRNEEQKLTVSVPCRQAWGAGMLCKAPVNFSLHFQKYHLSESIRSRISENRKAAFVLSFPELTNFCVMTQVVSRLLYFLIHSPVSGPGWSGRQALDRWMFLLISLDCGNVRTFLPAQNFISQTLFEVIHGISGDANFLVQKHLLDSVAQHATLAQPIALALRPVGLDATGEQFVELFRVIVNIMSPELTDSALYELLSRFVIVDWLSHQRPSHTLRFELCTLASTRLFHEQLKGDDYFAQVCKYLANALVSLSTFLFPDLFASFWQVLLELTTVSIRKSKTREKWLVDMWQQVMSLPLTKLSSEASLEACNSLSQLVASFRSDKSLFNTFRSLSPHILAFGRERLIACAHFRTREIWPTIWSFYGPWLAPCLHTTGSNAGIVTQDFVAVVAANGHSNTSRDIMTFLWPVLVTDILPLSSSQALALFHAKLLPSSFTRCVTTVTYSSAPSAATATATTTSVSSDLTYPSLNNTASVSSISSPPITSSSSILLSSSFSNIPADTHSLSALDSLVAAWHPDARVVGQMARLLGDSLRETSADSARKVQALTLFIMDLLSRANWYETAISEQKETKSSEYVLSFVSLILQCLRSVGDLPTAEQEGADVVVVHRLHSFIRSLLNMDWGSLVSDTTFSALLQAAHQHQNVPLSLKHWGGFQNLVAQVGRPRLRVGPLCFDLGSPEGRLYSGAQLLLAIALTNVAYYNSNNNSSNSSKQGDVGRYVLSGARVKLFLEWVVGSSPLSVVMLPALAVDCIHVIDAVCETSMCQPVSVLQALMYVINHQQASEVWTSSFITHVLSSCYAPSFCLATLTAACRSILSLPLLAVVVEACIDRLFFLALHSADTPFYTSDESSSSSPRFTTFSHYHAVLLAYDDLSSSNPLPSLSIHAPDFSNPSLRWRAAVDALEVPEMGYKEFVSACLERGCVYSLLAEEMDRRNKNLETKTELVAQVVLWLPNLKLPLPAPPLSLAHPLTSLTLSTLPLPSLPSLVGGGLSSVTTASSSTTTNTTATTTALVLASANNATSETSLEWWSINLDMSIHKCVKFLCAVRFELEWVLSCGSVQQGTSSLTQLTRLLLSVARQQHRLFTVASAEDSQGMSGVAVGGVKAVFGRVSRFLGYDRVFPELCLAAHAIASFLLMHSSLPVAKLSTNNLDFGDFGFTASSSAAPPISFANPSSTHTAPLNNQSIPQQVLAEFLLFTKSKLFVSSGTSPLLSSQVTAAASQLHGIAAHLDWLISKPPESSSGLTPSQSLRNAPLFLDTVVRGSFSGFPWP